MGVRPLSPVGKGDAAIERRRGICRIAYIPPGTDFNDPMVEDLFERLIKSQGGDGNGIATWKDKKAMLFKGMNAGPKELIKCMKENDTGRGWLFHTRMKSIGSRNEEFIQPFFTGKYLFVHNGHWIDWDRLYWPLLLSGDIEAGSAANDSVVISKLVEKAGPAALWSLKVGVFVVWGMEAEAPVLMLRSGDFAYSSLKKGGLIYASSFPHPKVWGVQSMEFKSDTLARLEVGGPKVLEGREPEAKSFRTYSTDKSGFRGRWQGNQKYLKGMVGDDDDSAAYPYSGYC